MTTPHRRGIGAVMGAVALTLALGPVPARAGDIDEKKAAAAALVAKLESQAHDIVALDKEHRRAVQRLTAADDAVARAQVELDAAGRRQDDARRLLARHAQEAYVAGGTVSMIGRMSRATVDDAGPRRTYLQVASGEDRQAIGRLRAAREDLGEKLAALDEARLAAGAKAKDIEADQARLERAMAGQRAVLAKVNGDLAVLVADEQRRRDAEAARLAAAAAAARATTAPAASKGTATTAPASGPAGAVPGPSASLDAVFACIRQLESGDNYSAPGGGAYQFTDDTWHSLGYSGTASDAPPAVQDEAARKLQARDGWAPWTTAALCGRV
jgi:peptidoglycan hydrolase CwlO-like protein